VVGYLGPPGLARFVIVRGEKVEEDVEQEDDVEEAGDAEHPPAHVQGLTLVPVSAQLELTLPLSAQLKLTLSHI